MTAVIPEVFIESMAEKFQMLADPSRLRILKALMSTEMNVGEIVKSTALSQANVSKHLRLLTKAHLLARRRAGLNVYYKLSDPIVERICTLVCKTILHEFKLSRQRRLPKLKSRSKS